MDNRSLTLSIIIVGLVGALTWYFWPSGYVAPETSLSELGLGTDSTTNAEPPETAVAEGFSYKNASSKDIRIELPFPDAKTGNEFSVRGKVSESWLQGKTLTVFVYDMSGNEKGIASAPVLRGPDGTLAFKSDVSVVRSFTGSATVIVVRNDTGATAETASLVSFPIVIKP